MNTNNQDQVANIKTAFLQPHPHNPRIEPRQEIVDQLAAQMANGFDPSHALIVRVVEGGYQIISGHHRWLAAQKAGLPEVPCWVRDLSDADYDTLESLLTHSGLIFAAGTEWTSTLGADAEIKTFTLIWTVEGTDHGDTTDHTITLPYCVLTGSLSEGDPDKVSVSFTSYAVWPAVT
jgi:hypothetical protein